MATEQKKTIEDRLFYSRMQSEIAATLSNRFNTVLKLREIASRPEYLLWRGECKEKIKNLVRQRSIKVNHHNFGDEVLITAMHGTSLEDGNEEYYFGGNNEDLPLGTKAHIVMTDGEKIQVTFPVSEESRINQTWTLHRSEVTLTGKNQYYSTQDAKTAERITYAILKQAEVLAKEKGEHERLELRSTCKDTRKAFVDLGLNFSEVAPMSLVIPVIEEIMHKKGRRQVKKIDYRNAPENDIALAKIIMQPENIEKRLNLIAKLNKDAKRPGSMLIDDAKELARHIGIIYQVSRANWIIDKSEIPGFPNGYCFRGSRNVTRGLLSIGYVNVLESTANWVSTSHGYVCVPFMMKNGTPGMIGVDPTSDQVEGYGESLSPNFVFVACGKNLRYPLSSFSKSAYFPDAVSYFKVKDGTINQDSTDNVRMYLDKAFKNPVKYDFLF